MDGTNLDVITAALAPPPGLERAGAAVPPQDGVDINAFLRQTAGARDDPNRRLVSSRASEGAAPLAALDGPAPPEGEISLEVVRDFSATPVRAVGRVTAYFDGKVRWCTGTVVEESLVLTAAHCLYQRASSDGAPARFADWVSFEPAYTRGASAGVWGGERLYLQRGWIAPQTGTNAGPHDFALVRLSAPIKHVTGAADILSGSVPDAPVTALGYPRKPSHGHNWDGEDLYVSKGEQLNAEDQATLKARNGLTEGSSGGPWFIENDGKFVLVGINSMKPVESDDLTWSPRLGAAFHRLLDVALADKRGP